MKSTPGKRFTETSREKDWRSAERPRLVELARLTLAHIRLAWGGAGNRYPAPSEPTLELLRTIGPLLIAIAAALYVDRTMARRGALPPRFAAPPLDLGAPALQASLRRALGTAVVGLILWAAAFAPLASLGEAPPSTEELTIPRLFLLHGLLAVTLAAWYALGYLPRRSIPRPTRVAAEDRSGAASRAEPVSPRPGGPDWRVAFGLEGSARRELAIGTAVGLAIWLGVLLVLLLLAGLVSLLGGREALPQQPPAMVLWIGALPLWARAAVAISAGVVEEIFFRGFLQPRVGVLASTVLFALAHLGYGQPFMLVGVTLLSLLYAELRRRRGSVWAPVAAHAIFDLVQLLVVVPLVAKALEYRDVTGVVAALARAVGRP
jgi:membrane protease YdiL (CAAX protease family)